MGVDIYSNNNQVNKDVTVLVDLNEWISHCVFKKNAIVNIYRMCFTEQRRALINVS